MHIPIVGARDTLFQIARTRGGVSLGMAGQNEGREFEGQEFLGFRTGDGIAIEEGVARHRHQSQIAVHVLLHKLRREVGIMGQDRGPWASRRLAPPDGCANTNPRHAWG